MRLPASVAILGTVLDLVYIEDGKIQKTSFPDHVMCADKRLRTVWIWPKKTKASGKSPAQLKAASKVYRLWSEFDPDEVLDSTPSLGKNIELLGPVRTIGYRSNKWKKDRRTEDYEHQYESKPKLFRSGAVWWIRGGKQRITSRGIVG